MALPQDIGGASNFPAQNYYCGPFRSSGGAYYTIMYNDAALKLIAAWKNTDPGTASWAEQDSANHPSLTNIGNSVWAFQEGDDLHIAHQEQSTGRLGYSIFHMATDLWDGTIVNELIETPTEAPTSSSCSIAVMDARAVVLYNGDMDRVHGTRFDRVDYAIRNGTWASVGNAVDNAGQDDWFGSVAIPSDAAGHRVHFFFKNWDLSDGYQRTLHTIDGTEALETFPAAGETSSSLDKHMFGPGVNYDDGGTIKIRAPYLDGPVDIAYAEFDSVDAPGAFTPNTGVSDASVRQLNQYPVVCVSVDGIDVYLLYSEEVTFDLWLDKNDGVDTEELDAVTVNRISSNIYDRNTTKLAYVYDDGGTIKYNEVKIDIFPPFALPQNMALRL